MKKAALLDKIVAHLKGQVSRFAAAAETSRAEATDEENQAEDKYDTRGLEASYLAAGQSRQMAEMADALQQFATLVPTRFHATTPIDVGALVDLASKRETTRYFIGPAAGGTEIRQGPSTILVLTPQSPLGRQLIGRTKGEKLTMKIGPFTDTYTITNVE